MRLAAGDGIVDGLFEMLEKFDGGVFVLNGRREIALMNARAERLLGDGLTVVRRRLLASAQPAASSGLLISSAFDEPDDRGLDTGDLAEA